MFLAKHAAESPEGARADPLCLHEAAGSCLGTTGAPRPRLSRLQRLECRRGRDSAREQGLGQSRAAQEVTARVTASQTGTAGQPLPSSPSWSSWGTLASRPLGFGARRPPGSWQLPLESWSPPPRLMRARLLTLGARGETGEAAASGSPRVPERGRGTQGPRSRDCPQGAEPHPAGDCQRHPALTSWVLNQKSAQMLSPNTQCRMLRGSSPGGLESGEEGAESSGGRKEPVGTRSWERGHQGSEEGADAGWGAVRCCQSTFPHP